MLIILGMHLKITLNFRKINVYNVFGKHLENTWEGPLNSAVLNVNDYLIVKITTEREKT